MHAALEGVGIHPALFYPDPDAVGQRGPRQNPLARPPALGAEDWQYGPQRVQLRLRGHMCIGWDERIIGLRRCWSTFS